MLVNEHLSNAKPEEETYLHTETHPHGFVQTHDHGRGGAKPHSHKERDTHEVSSEHHDPAQHAQEAVELTE